MENSLINFNGAKLAIDSLNAMPDQVDRAARIAIKATVKSAEANISRDITRQHRLPNSFKLKRVIASDKGLKGSVWVGASDVEAWKLGKQKQSKGGVRAGRHFFKSGFLATMASGHTSGFKRKNSATKWTKGRSRTSSPNLGIEHLKVKLTKIDQIVKRQENAAQKKLENIFARELQQIQQGNTLR